MSFESSILSLILTFSVFLFLDGILRGSSKLDGTPRLLMVGICATVALSVTFGMWGSLSEAIEKTTSFQGSFKAIVPEVLVTLGVGLVINMSGVYLGRKITASTQKGSST